MKTGPMESIFMLSEFFGVTVKDDFFGDFLLILCDVECDMT